MHNLTWYRLLAVGMLAAPMAGQVPGPQPKIKEIATIPGAYVDAFVRMPNGRVIVYGDGDSLFAYDLTTKRRTFIARDWNSGLAISPRGDRIAYGHNSEDHKSYYLWTIAINPATGSPSGAAQRVTTCSGDSPSFSPDGTLIAFDMDKPNGARGQNLAVIPATGGMQRVLAEYDKPIDGATSWSADGKWVYVQLNSDSIQTIERVSAAGGKSATLFSYRSPDGTDGSVDGQLAFFRPDGAADSKGRMAYLAAGGGHGEFQIPANAYPGTNKGVPRTLRQVTRPNLLHILDLATGKVRDVPTQGDRPRWVTMSPDPTRLAFEIGDSGHLERVVSKTDGSDQRRYPTTDGSRSLAPWSADGKGLVYFTDSTRSFRMLDLATGASRLIGSVPGPNRIALSFPVWQPGGQSFLTIAATGTYLGAHSNYAVIEMHLDGTTRIVRNLSAEFPSISGAFLTSNRQALVSLGDSAAGTQMQYVLAPLDGGPVRRVVMPILDPGVRVSLLTGQFTDKWFVANLLKGKDLIGFQVMSTGTDSTRVFRFPANRYMTTAQVAPFLRDDKHLVTFGKLPESDSIAVYSIPLDGTPTHVVGHIPDPRVVYIWSAYGLSSDRKSFAFFSAGPPTSHLYDVDLTPILNLVKKP